MTGARIGTFVEYEWAVGVEDENEDVGDLHFESTYADAMKTARVLREDLPRGCKVVIELYRNDVRDGDLSDRQFAEIRGGKLPETFDKGAPIPKRIRDEVSAWRPSG